MSAHEPVIEVLPTDGSRNMAHMGMRAGLASLVSASRSLVKNSSPKRFKSSPYIPETSRGMAYSIFEKGCPNTTDFRVFIKNEDGPISPFHDVPLFANEGNKIFNMVVEVPRWTNAKMEIATKDPLNPIKQDVKKGKLRYVANCFPHHGYIWNYGALPQTWEDPSHIDEASGCKGDNDPIDVCEIGYRVAKRGEVIQVKVLGTIALIDEGETDWKLIAIDVNDPMAPQLSDISDVEKHMPGFLKATVEWFRIYKIPDGKPENQFAFSGMPKDRDFAHKIIMETHEAWQNLIEGKSDAGGLSTACVSVPNAANKVSHTEAAAVQDASPEPGPGQTVDPKVDLWHFVTLK
ncbi:inorganic pyrophosphatase-like [Homarus americanus]|uniref:inorganic pyrophosphatase-like n=1 Tax=Homarus americanus TaxID=6706 RepID=UPI001C440052|nr:inorganic pyrophosphatase-like [Homarus americanus]